MKKLVYNLRMYDYESEEQAKADIPEMRKKFWHVKEQYQAEETYVVAYHRDMDVETKASEPFDSTAYENRNYQYDVIETIVSSYDFTLWNMYPLVDGTDDMILILDLMTPIGSSRELRRFVTIDTPENRQLCKALAEFHQRSVMKQDEANKIHHYYVWCDGKKQEAETKRKAVNLAKRLAAESFSHRAGVYEDGVKIRTITIDDLC